MADSELPEPRGAGLPNLCPVCGERRRLMANGTEGADWRCFCPMLSDSAWHRDVLALVPPTEDIVRLESAWCLVAGSSQLMKLALWQPPEDDEFLRQFLLDFGHEVAVAAWKSPDRQEGVCDEQTYARLKELAFKDEVTGLYNRRFFSIRLEEEVSRYRHFNHPVSVVLLDLDNFKAINDGLGYAAGAETLRGMADILLNQTRGINVICRYGGDRFATLLVETSKNGARLYADRIRYILSSSTFSHGRRVTASFGIASLPEVVTPSTEELIRAADEALYAAKRAGKNRVSIHEDNDTGRDGRGLKEG
jgi:diguanylate cyclase (GGDEF)-like protein